MPFIPHTATEVAEMLAAIGADSIESLFDEIPSGLRSPALSAIPAGMGEMAVGRTLRELARKDGAPLCFIGAGAYDHHIPAAVWDIATRGEFYSAYTPYQAEASQGTLQLIYEFQTMISELTAMEVSNASLYDGATALAEAVLMAVRANRGSKSQRILLPQSLHPAYRQVVHTIVHAQGIELVELPYDAASGQTDLAALACHQGEDFAALVIPQPNFFGVLEPADEMTDWAHNNGALVIGVVNPVSLALIKAPGQWGAAGADIAVGEGQPLGLPLSSGGPYLGFMAATKKLVRQMPGRIVGRTVDLEGKPGFTLTLQAREQHIRRSKATSNICTNQGLMACAATIHMALLGPTGLEQVASASMANTYLLRQRLAAIDGVAVRFNGPHFHEVVLTLDQPVHEVLRALAVQDILGGYALGDDYPELESGLLICATECRTEAEIERYADNLERILSRRRPQASCSKKVPQNPEALGFTMGRGETV